MKEADIIPYPARKETIPAREVFLNRLEDLPSDLDQLPHFIKRLTFHAGYIVGRDLNLSNQGISENTASYLEPAVVALKLANCAFQIYGKNLNNPYDFITIAGPLLQNLNQEKEVPDIANYELFKNSLKVRRRFLLKPKIIGVSRDWYEKEDFLGQYFADLVSLTTLVYTKGEITEDAFLERRPENETQPFVFDQEKRKNIKQQAKAVTQFCWDLLLPKLKRVLQNPELVKELSPTRITWIDQSGRETHFEQELNQLMRDLRGKTVVFKNPKTGEDEVHLLTDLVETTQDILQFWDQHFEVEGVGEEEIADSQPTIILDSSLEKPDIPYTVDVDIEKYTTFLREIGLDDNQIERHALVLQKGSWLPIGGYVTIFSPNKITLNANAIWRWHFYKPALNYAEKLARKEKKPDKNEFGQIRLQDLLYTKRLPEYLAVAPPERAARFAKKVLLQSFQRQINSALAHEAKHVSDFINGNPWVLGSLLMKINTVGGAGLGLSRLIPNEPYWNLAFYTLSFAALFLEYPIDPMEIRSSLASRKYKNHPEWRSIITVKLKEELN